ncbi:precorrin-2 dehydrogenase/sirohydrochlorin ferrochelatase family protein [Polycladidibacter hongkongensis]|uniref:precorrin-2 dehydrogenase/sirohydrochlorin ferrochelatase family protein n=1 Tax=Polycladidibacter hongkongensis TaxID=1647556 RepID=UPI00082ADD48|nr:NAD(P)-dependent oxidoreductase [Pseudovibrio hongkongensis]
MRNTSMHSRNKQNTSHKGLWQAQSHPSRIEALSVLPVFFSLHGKTVIMVGASDAILWKLELILAAGADVELFIGTQEPSHELLDFIAERPKVRMRRQQWEPAAFIGKAFALADLTKGDEAARFYQSAKAQGLPVNIIDQPEYCDFQFGSIVNRGPCVIGISTSGAAPVLGQAIRQRLEAVLPQQLSQFARLARRLRPLVMSRLTTSQERRHFWWAFVDRIWSEGSRNTLLKTDCAAVAYAQVEHSNRNLAQKTALTQYISAPLAGSDYLTLRDLRVLQTAEVIYYENGVPEKVLELARREALRRPIAERPVEDEHMAVVVTCERLPNVVQIK